MTQLISQFAINHFRDGDNIRSAWRDGLTFDDEHAANKTFGGMTYNTREDAVAQLRDMCAAKMDDCDPDSTFFYSKEDIASSDFDSFSYDTHNWRVISIEVS